MRCWVVVGRSARASADFSLDDLPSTAGRLDVLLRCVRAGLLISDGVRRDTLVYLVLLGGPNAPRTLRFDGGQARYLRPDERALANVVQKALRHEAGVAFTALRNGVSIAAGGLDAVLDDLPAGTTLHVLDAEGQDLRAAVLGPGPHAFFVGDALGLDAVARHALAHARPVSLGPVSLHADDAIAVATNELDRRGL